MADTAKIASVHPGYADVQSGKHGRSPVNKNGLSISCGHFSMRGIRPEMEDQVLLLPHPLFLEEVLRSGVKKETKLDESVARSFFAVYDGHAGTVCAKYCKQNVHHNFYKDEVFTTDVGKALCNGLLTTDKNFTKGCRDLNLLASSGSTAIASFIEDNVLMTANVGDSRGVLCRSGKAVALSIDHKPGRPDEVRRIEKLGGKVGITEDDAFDRIRCAFFCKPIRRCMDPDKPLRIFPGGLSVSRTIGDISLKATNLIIADPELTTQKLDVGDEFFILACDGVWDVLNNQQAVNVVRTELSISGDAEAASRALAQHAFKQGSADNISVLVGVFHWKGTESDQKSLALDTKTIGTDAPPPLKSPTSPQETPKEIKKSKALRAQNHNRQMTLTGKIDFPIEDDKLVGSHGSTSSASESSSTSSTSASSSGSSSSGGSSSSASESTSGRSIELQNFADAPPSPDGQSDGTDGRKLTISMPDESPKPLSLPTSSSSEQT